MDDVMRSLMWLDTIGCKLLGLVKVERRLIGLVTPLHIKEVAFMVLSVNGGEIEVDKEESKHCLEVICLLASFSVFFLKFLNSF